MKLIDNIKERIPNLYSDWWEGRYANYVKLFKSGEDKSQYDDLLPEPIDINDTAVVFLLYFTEKPSVKVVEKELLEMLKEDYPDFSLKHSIHDSIEKDDDFYNCYFLVTFHTDEDLSLPTKEEESENLFQAFVQKIMEMEQLEKEGKIVTPPDPYVDDFDYDKD